MRLGVFCLLPLMLSAAPSPAAPTPAAPVVVPDSLGTILGVRPGADLDDVRAALRPLGTTRSGADGDKPKPGKADRDEEEGHTELWTLRGSPYAQIVFKSDAYDQVLWITGVLRPGQEIAFTRFAALGCPLVSRDTLAVWTVLRPQTPYRLIARGAHGRANVLSLISLARPRTQARP